MKNIFCQLVLLVIFLFYFMFLIPIEKVRGGSNKIIDFVSGLSDSDNIEIEIKIRKNIDAIADWVKKDPIPENSINTIHKNAVIITTYPDKEGEKKYIKKRLYKQELLFGKLTISSENETTTEPDEIALIRKKKRYSRAINTDWRVDLTYIVDNFDEPNTDIVPELEIEYTGTHPAEAIHQLVLIENFVNQF